MELYCERSPRKSIKRLIKFTTLMSRKQWCALNVFGAMFCKQRSIEKASASKQTHRSITSTKIMLNIVERIQSLQLRHRQRFTYRNYNPWELLSIKSCLIASNNTAWCWCVHNNRAFMCAIEQYAELENSLVSNIIRHPTTSSHTKDEPHDELGAYWVVVCLCVWLWCIHTPDRQDETIILGKR